MDSITNELVEEFARKVKPYIDVDYVTEDTFLSLSCDWKQAIALLAITLSTVLDRLNNIETILKGGEDGT